MFIHELHLVQVMDSFVQKCDVTELLDIQRFFKYSNDGFHL